MKDIKNLQNLLKITYGVVPIVAGLDKYTNLLTDWPEYLGSIADVIPFDSSLFMMAIGLVEMAAGVLVLTKTKLGSFVVMVWLAVIALTLIINGMLDIAVRDLVMAIGAYTLYRLTIFIGQNSNNKKNL